MKLKEIIKVARLEEKTNNKHSILYQVFEKDICIYVGIGGKGKSKGSRRLSEHYNTPTSSFKVQYFNDKWDKGFTRLEAQNMWDQLEWDIIQFNTIEEADILETKLIKQYNPHFNKDKK